MGMKILVGITFFVVFLLFSTSTVIHYVEGESIDGLIDSVENRRYSRLDFSFDNKTIMFAVILVTLALLFYSTSVLLELYSGILKPFHVKLFWIGLLFDISGTLLMSTLSSNNSNPLHMLIGFIAISLMLFHTVLASIIVKTGNILFLEFFPKFSLTVYMIWLLSFITGMIIGMKNPGIESKPFLISTRLFLSIHCSTG